jgi:hypothetical protein
MPRQHGIKLYGLKTALAGSALDRTQSISAAVRVDLKMAGYFLCAVCRVRRKIYVSLEVTETVRAVLRIVLLARRMASFIPLRGVSLAEDS